MDILKSYGISESDLKSAHKKLMAIIEAPGSRPQHVIAAVRQLHAVVAQAIREQSLSVAADESDDALAGLRLLNDQHSEISDVA